VQGDGPAPAPRNRHFFEVTADRNRTNLGKPGPKTLHLSPSHDAALDHKSRDNDARDLL
jgi:hypothetical protein